MTEDQIGIEPEPRERRGGGRMVAAGVVGACVLGAGLGLWARPAAEDRGFASEVPEAAAAPTREPTRILQIVVDDTPAPVGQPLEVLPAEPLPEARPESSAPILAPAAPQAVAPVAPRRPPEGLMKVADSIEAEPVEALPPPKPAAKPKAEAKPKAQAQAQPKLKAEPARPKAQKAVAKDEAPARREKAKVAKAEPAKSRKADTVRLAKADGPKAKAKAENRKDARLAAVVRVVKKAPAKAKAEIRLAERKAAKAKKDREIQLAEAKKAKAAKAEKQREFRLAEARKTKADKARRDKAARVQLAKAETPKARPPARAPQVQRVRNTCAAADPGEALVCGDPRLNVRERQMQRAYRDAEAAGVPASELRRQQDRWRAARAAAARDAPWAVEEVYEARIAELNDLSRRDSSY